MANNYDNSDGVWRTIGGRRVFIRTGQSLSEAMIESGKFKNLRSDYRKAKEEEAKNKNITSSEAIDELMNADTGDWNNMNQAQRDKTCEKILQDFEDKYGDKLKDEKFRKEVLDGLEDQNFHTMGKIIEQKYEYSNDPVLSNLDVRMAEIQSKRDAVNKSFEENQKQLQAKLNKDDISPMSEYSDTIGDGLTDAQRKEVREAVKTSFLYKDEGEMSSGLKKNQEKYGKEAVDDALKYYNDNYELIKGVASDSEGLTYNDMIAKKDYPEDALKYYKNQMENLRNSGLQYSSSREYNEKADALRNELEASKNQETFTSQSTNPFYDDYTYTKEQLDKMAENKIKPMKNTYSGRGWEGTNYDSNLSTKEIAKNISDYSKKEFPDVKLSRKTDYNSMDISIIGSSKDLYASSSDIDKMTDKEVFDTINSSTGGVVRLDDWLDENNRKVNGGYTAQDARDYLKSELNTYKSRNGYRAVGDEWYLSDYGKKVVSGLNREMNSYNFDDDDPMTDYFHSNFYGYVNIGKWDKPYEVKQKTMNDKIRDEAFRKYKKEHPGSKMTLDDFLKKK